MLGRPIDLMAHRGLRRLRSAQRAVVRRDQLRRLGIDNDVVSAHVRALRWRALGPVVVALENGDLDVDQQRWAAVLAAGDLGALSAWTALEAAGLRGFERPEVHVVVPRGAKPTSLGRRVGTRVVVHESRRHEGDDVLRLRHSAPRHRAARAAVDAAAWGSSNRAAAAIVAATVQQRLARVEDLHTELGRVPGLRRRRLIRHVLVDVEGGAEALSELDFARLCRDAGLPEPRRQARRHDSQGRFRYLDAEWVRADGRRVVVEVDGRGHRDQAVWEDDLLRANDVVIGEDAVVLRVPATVLRTRPDRVVAQLRRALAVA